MEVSAANHSILTPQELLDKFKKGERPDYTPDKNDKTQNELDALAKKYKQTMSLDSKVELMTHERNMLYEELTRPELTLSRNYKDISEIMPETIKGQELQDTLRLFNVTGIYRMERLGGIYQHKTPAEKIDILKETYKTLDENNSSGSRAKSYIITTLSDIKERNPEHKQKINNTLNELLELTKDNSIKESIFAAKDEFNEKSAIESLKSNQNQDYLFRNLILKGKNEETKEFITSILKSENIEPDIYKTAILGAGRFRSDENFEIIKNIALDKKETDIRKREFAIQSTALYLKEKPQEVKEIMTTIERENSVFSLLGRIMHDKITGNYHGQKDRELNYSGYTKKQTIRFKNLFNRFYQTDTPFNRRKENTCQLNILPFKKQLGRFVGNGMHYIVQNDTYTRQDKENVAKRYFFKNAGIYNAGDYYDAFDGISADKYNMMNHYRVQSANHQNQMAHENGHSLHEMFDKKDLHTLSNLYKKAKREGRILDYYAAANQYEYFAQGCDAIASVYKPHKYICSNNPLAHTVYELMDKDPDLFKFIKEMMKKYH